MQASDIPTYFTKYWGVSAGSPFIRNIPAASQIGITNGAASLADGFPPLNFDPVASGGVPPFGQDFNGILRQVTQWLQFAQAGAGIWFYDSAFATAIGGYPAGAMLQSTSGAGNFWISTADDNLTDPDDAGTRANWTPFPGPSLVYPSVIQTTNTTFNFNCDTNYSLGLLRASPGAITINLAFSGSLLLNQVFEVEDLSGNMSLGVATVLPPAGHLIAGAASFTMNIDRQSTRFKYYGPSGGSGQWSVRT